MFKSISPQFAIKPTLWSVFLLFSPLTRADGNAGSDELYFQELSVVFTASPLSEFASYGDRVKAHYHDLYQRLYPEDTLRRLGLRLTKTFQFNSGRSAEVAFTVQNATESKYWKCGAIKESAGIFFTRRGRLTAMLNF